VSEAIAGAVGALRMLTDGSVSVSIVFEPKDRMAVMSMMGEPGASIACVRLANGHAKASDKPASSFRDLGPICREAIDLTTNPKFQEYILRFNTKHIGDTQNVSVRQDIAKKFILTQCQVESRKELDTSEGARDLFIEHVRKPFLAWMARQAEA
jgi:hypothetical protein